MLFSPLAEAARQPFSPQDWWYWRSASDPRISADGRWVVYVEYWNDQTADAGYTNLWLASTDGKSRRQFTQGNWRDTNPRWSPDGTRLAWISDRGGQTHIAVKGAETGPETQIAAPGATNLAWSFEGDWLAYTAPVTARFTPPAWAPPAILPRLRRTRESYLQVFIVPAGGGAAKQITSGDFDHLGEPAWMPDGKSILAARDDGQIHAYRIADGTEKAITKEAGRNDTPVPSPDGTKVAWLETDPKQQSYAVHRLYVMNADGTRVKLLTGTLDRDPVDPQWSSDSRVLYFVADDHGVSRIYAARNDGSLRQVNNGKERFRGFSLADTGRAVAVRSSATEAGDVFTFTVDHVSQPVTLAAPNEHLLAERDIGAVEELAYESAGHPIQAWAVKPAGFDAARKYPLLLDIQDDPRAMYGVDFNLRAQIYAAQGFVVLCVNPRGTPGYGEEFGNLLHSRYPGDDYDDLMAGVDAVVKKGYIDSTRLTVVGGLLAAWTIGHTDRFHAAVARHPIVDWATHVATVADGARRARSWMGAMPWEDTDQYVKHSPVYFAQNFKTPTLVLAGDPDPESEELYFALQEKKVQSALVRMGPAGKPSDWILELQTILAWLKL